MEKKIEMSNERFLEKIEYYSNITTGFTVDYITGLKAEKRIEEAMLYSLGGGKHIRPALLLGAFNIFGEDEYEKALPFASALEMIHTYSLIHDDLPAMDDDDMRRGKPSSHIKYGEALAILAGDALLNCAARCMLENISYNDYGSLKAANIIMKSAGAEGMIGGQCMDLKGAETKHTLRKMYFLKTGALIKAAATAGAVIANCNKQEEHSIMEYAENAGYAFQLTDDLLDVYGNADIIGKPTGSDKKNSKVTIVSLMGKAETEKVLAEVLAKALKQLDEIDKDTWFLEELMKFIVERKD